MRTPEEEQALALAAAIESEKQYILTDMPTEEFIDTYCYIENKDDPLNPVIKFDMWPEQRRALREILLNRLTIILKARQLGFTWLVLCIIVHCTLQFKGYRTIVLSQTEDKSKELVKRCELILQHLPTWLIISDKKMKEFEKKHGKGSYVGMYYVATTFQIEVHRTGEELVSIILAQPSTEGAGRSLTGDIVFFDEWAFHKFASDVFDAAFPTIARPTSGKFIGLSTNKRGSFYEATWKHAVQQKFHQIFLSCFADPRRTQDWYDDTAATMRNKMLQEFPRTPEEALNAGDNVSFPEFSEDIHVCEPFRIPEHWRRFGGVDNGFNDPYAWYKIAISEDGILYVYYEQSRWRSEPQVIYSDQAKEFASSFIQYDPDTMSHYKEHLDYIVAGKDAWHTHTRDTTGKNLIDYYREGGLDHNSFVPAVTDRMLRKATVHEYLKPFEDPFRAGKLTSKVQIFSTCTYLIDILPQLVNDDKNVECVADLSDIDNPYDSFGYMLISYHVAHSKQIKTDTRTQHQKHKEQLLKRANRPTMRRRRV